MRQHILCAAEFASDDGVTAIDDALEHVAGSVVLAFSDRRSEVWLEKSRIEQE